MKKILIFFGVLGFAGVAFAAPTSTIVKYLILDPSGGGGTNCLHRTPTGLVTTSTADCGSGSGGVATSSAGTPTFLPIWTSASALGNSTLSQAGGTTLINGSTALLDGAGDWIGPNIFMTSDNALLLMNGANNSIVQNATATAVLGELIIGGGARHYSTSTVLTTTEFCHRGLTIIDASTTADVTLTMPTFPQINSSTPATGGCGPVEPGSYNEQFVWNLSNFPVHFKTTAPAEQKWYSFGTPQDQDPGTVYKVTGQGRTSSTFDFYSTQFATSTNKFRVGTSTIADQNGHIIFGDIVSGFDGFDYNHGIIRLYNFATAQNELTMNGTGVITGVNGNLYFGTGSPSPVSDVTLTLNGSNIFNVAGSQAIGTGNSVTGQHSLAAGDTNTVASDNSTAFGRLNDIGSGIGSSNFISGSSNSIAGGATYSTVFGNSNVVGLTTDANIMGNANEIKAGASDSVLLGNSNTIETDAYDNFAIGDSNDLFSTGVSAIGYSNTAQNTVSNGQIMGTLLNLTGDNSIVLGKGVNTSNRLTVSATSTLVFGMNTTSGLMFITPRMGDDLKGRVGIGTVQPQAVLHVKGNLEEDSKLAYAGTGTIEDDGSGNILCDDTCAFTTELAPGDTIYIPDTGEFSTVASVIDNSNMTLTAWTQAIGSTFNIYKPALKTLTGDGTIGLFLSGNGGLGVRATTTIVRDLTGGLEDYAVNAKGTIHADRFVAGTDYYGGDVAEFFNGITRMTPNTVDPNHYAFVASDSGLTHSLIMAISASDSSFQANGNKPMWFGMDNHSYQFQIATDGTVGVETQYPSSTLHVVSLVGKNPLTIASSSGTHFLDVSATGTVNGLPGGIWSQPTWTLFTQTANGNVNNTTTANSVIGTGVGTSTLPANFFVPGKTVCIHAAGVYRLPLTGGSATVSITYATTTLATVTTTGLLSNSPDQRFRGDICVTGRTTGTTGTVAIDGAVGYSSNAATNVYVEDPLNNGGATVTINTARAALLDVKVAWDTAAATKSATTTVVTYESKN